MLDNMRGVPPKVMASMPKDGEGAGENHPVPALGQEATRSESRYETSRNTLDSST